MTIETAETLAYELGTWAPTARYEFAMQGEPLLNPRHLEILKLFRPYLYQTQMMLTTNGRKLMGHMQERLEALFATGLDFIILDTYYPERDKLRTEVSSLKGFNVKDFYKDLAPRAIQPYSKLSPKIKQGRLIILMDDLGKCDGQSRIRIIYNHCGNSALKPPLDEPLKLTCTLPFREITFKWNGEVRLCCMDWKGEYVCGSIYESTPDEIWRGERFYEARLKLQARHRDFRPCMVCDVRGCRPGLLPKYPVSEVARYAQA
jgi:hypothetical protein